MNSETLPILEPDLYLTRSQTRNLPRKALSMSSIWMCLASELAHQETCLVMC